MQVARGELGRLCGDMEQLPDACLLALHGEQAHSRCSSRLEVEF